MTNNQHGQVPEALIDLIDAYAETRHRYGRIHNARTEAARNAVIEALSEVQALSAASPTPPAEQTFITPETGNSASAKGAAITCESGTPPAEQQATKETSGGFHVWRDISTAPKDGSRFVATGHNYGLYSEVRHTCVAQWFRGCWMEASDWNKTSELKYLTHWMPLPSPPDDVAAPAEQAAPKAAPVTQQAGYAEVIECGNSYAKVKLKGEAFGSTKVGDIFYTAPQQEAQEPALFVSAKQLASLADPSHATAGSYLPARKTRAGLFTMALYTAPQPAPLSEMPYEKRKAIQEGEQISASDAWFHARFNMLDTLDRRNVFRAGFDRGWNAALAAQGGK